MDTATPGSFIKISGDIVAVENVSAVTTWNDCLIIGSDEGTGTDNKTNCIQLLKIKKDGSCKVQHNILVFQGSNEEGNEMDIEGICTEGDCVYVIGSHSARRERFSLNNTYKENQTTFYVDKIEKKRSRDWLYRIRLDAKGNEIDKNMISLRKILMNDPALKAFCEIPAKENGIDIEGIAAKDGWLYVGFRGPVFRDNYVPVMKLRFDDPETTYALLYVQLGGRGIRDLAIVSDGFLILAGPIGGGSDSYQVLHWDGKDTVSGKDRSKKEVGTLHLLGEIEPQRKEKIEGMAVIEEQKSAYQLIIAYDGTKDKDRVLQRFSVNKFPSSS